MSPSSHSCGGTDAEEAQPVSQHLSGGIIQGQPGVVHRLDFLGWGTPILMSARQNTHGQTADRIVCVMSWYIPCLAIWQG